MEEKMSITSIELTPHVDNMQKYDNYREQMGRLKKALKNYFYLEAIFIEYSIMEDRLESILRHAGVWENMIEKERKQKKREDVFISIETKIRKISELARRKNSLENKYFSVDLMESVKSWKENRNPLTHALLKKQLHTKDLEDIAVKGEEIVRILCSKSTSYRRAREKNKAD